MARKSAGMNCTPQAVLNLMLAYKLCVSQPAVICKVSLSEMGDMSRTYLKEALPGILVHPKPMKYMIKIPHSEESIRTC